MREKKTGTQREFLISVVNCNLIGNCKLPWPQFIRSDERVVSFSWMEKSYVWCIDLFANRQLIFFLHNFLCLVLFLLLVLWIAHLNVESVFFLNSNVHYYDDVCVMLISRCYCCLLNVSHPVWNFKWIWKRCEMSEVDVSDCVWGKGDWLTLYLYYVADFSKNFCSNGFMQLSIIRSNERFLLHSTNKIRVVCAFQLNYSELGAEYVLRSTTTTQQKTTIFS